jgi:cell division protein FtsI (penicillin-binding protein 3)
MLPAEKPELIIYHVVMNPQGDSFLGGRIAAPPVREAADQLSNYLGIVRGRNTVITHSGTVVIPAEQALQIGDTMPNLIGYAKRQLLPLLAREDINITIRGEGWVNTQSPEPGTKIEHGTQIYLELK